jgi:hypothetical protein
LIDDFIDGTTSTFERNDRTEPFPAMTHLVFQLFIPYIHDTEDLHNFGATCKIARELIQDTNLTKNVPPRYRFRITNDRARFFGPSNAGSTLATKHEVKYYFTKKAFTEYQNTVYKAEDDIQDTVQCLRSIEGDDSDYGRFSSRNVIIQCWGYDFGTDTFHVFINENWRGTDFWLSYKIECPDSHVGVVTPDKIDFVDILLSHLEETETFSEIELDVGETRSVNALWQESRSRRQTAESPIAARTRFSRRFLWLSIAAASLKNAKSRQQKAILLRHGTFYYNYIFRVGKGCKETYRLTS